MLPPDSERAGASRPGRSARRSARRSRLRMRIAARRVAAIPGARSAAPGSARRSRSPTSPVADHADRGAVLGHARDAGTRHTRAASAGSARPATRISPRVGAQQAAQHVGELRLAVAGHAGDAEISPRVDRESRARSSLSPAADARSPRSSAARLRIRAWRRAHRRLDAMADHQLGQLRLAWSTPRRASPPACPAAAPRCGRETRSTSSSLWLMKMIDSPSATSVLKRGEQRLGLLRRQHRGRLVEDQHARAAVQRLQDLHALALADRQLGDARVGIDAQPELAARSRAGRRARLRRRENGCHSGSVPSITLSSTDRLSASVKCWCTMPMPAASAGRRIARRQRLPERLRSCRRRRRSGRTGSRPAWTCRRRSRPAAPAPRRAPARARWRRWRPARRSAW